MYTVQYIVLLLVLVKCAVPVYLLLVEVYLNTSLIVFVYVAQDECIFIIPLVKFLPSPKILIIPLGYGEESSDKRVVMVITVICNNCVKQGACYKWLVHQLVCVSREDWRMRRS